MSTSVFNRCWSKVILTTLVRQGVKHICIAPGSRSTPLTLEASRLQQEGKVKCHTHFDERGLAFFALGLAKADYSPVAIIVTSGTACANLYPAIVEARQTGVNLVVLTADRPPELVECGANQAILQTGMFASYPVATVNLPKADSSYSPKWLISTLSYACLQQKHQPGVIHINVPFAEPLYGAEPNQIDHHSWILQVNDWLNQHKNWVSSSPLQQEVVMHENWDYWRTKRGVIVVGQLPAEQAMGIHLWATTLGWVLLTDIQSTVLPTSPYEDIWLANQTVVEKLLQADIVIQLGSRIISKRINQFLAQFSGEYWVVEQSQKAVDPYHHLHTRFNAKVHHWIRVHPPLRQRPWLLEPLALSKFCANFIEQQLGTNLNEATLAFYMQRVLPYNGLLFIGNSLFVRLADALTLLPEGYPVYTNRGASGIDGLLATCAGLAVGTEQPLVAIIGDTSALYDLNSLALFRNVAQPTIIFVLNNNGGAIFDILPVDEQVKDQYYRMPHDCEFSQIASMFNLKYAQPRSWSELNSVLKQAYMRRKTTLIELKTSPTEASQLYQDLIKQISSAVIGA